MRVVIGVIVFCSLQPALPLFLKKKLLLGALIGKLGISRGKTVYIRPVSSAWSGYGGSYSGHGSVSYGGHGGSYGGHASSYGGGVSSLGGHGSISIYDGHGSGSSYGTHGSHGYGHGSTGSSGIYAGLSSYGNYGSSSGHSSHSYSSHGPQIGGYVSSGGFDGHGSVNSHSDHGHSSPASYGSSGHGSFGNVHGDYSGYDNSAGHGSFVIHSNPSSLSSGYSDHGSFSGLNSNINSGYHGHAHTTHTSVSGDHFSGYSTSSFGPSGGGSHDSHGVSDFSGSSGTYSSSSFPSSVEFASPSTLYGPPSHSAPTSDYTIALVKPSPTSEGWSSSSEGWRYKRSTDNYPSPDFNLLYATIPEEMTPDSLDWVPIPPPTTEVPIKGINIRTPRTPEPSTVESSEKPTSSSEIKDIETKT